MRISAKSVLAGVAVIAAIAVSTAPSEAAKRKTAKCDVGSACSANCKGNTCELRRCDADGKTYVYFPLNTCAKGVCPPKC